VTDVIFVGGGHNGLAAAALVARGGAKTLVLEARESVGGAAITDEIHPGFRISTLAHAAQPAARLMAELRLAAHGLELIEPDPYLFAPVLDGRGLWLSRSAGDTATSIATFSKEDARRYPDFRDTLERLRPFIGGIMASPPPEIEQPSNADLWSLLMMGRRFRGLGRKDAYRLLRWSPMSAADFVTEWFESEPLRAAIAAGGIFGTSLGPRSAGSAAVLLMRLCAGDGAQRLVRGGLGSLSAALASAARAAGAEIRTGVEVSRIDVKDGRATGVTLKSGEALDAKAVVSNADPRRTLLGMVDPVHLPPGFLARIRTYRAAGTMAKINLALSGLPHFTSMSGQIAPLHGFIHIGPELDYLERAFDASKYGLWSPRPYLEVTIPSLTDPSLAPAGGHVMSITAQYAPYRLHDTSWDVESAPFADAVIATLAAYAPDLPSLILRRQVITPVDLETNYGLTGGHIFHGELALDQLFTMRPLLGWARYRTPIRGLYLCGSGTHPGYGVSGLSGANAAREILRDLF
jgi:phytoene dehydrogenase-like protein